MPRDEQSGKGTLGCPLSDHEFYSNTLLKAYWPSERRAIIQHSMTLSEELRRHASLQEALESWESGVARNWRKKKMSWDTEKQIAEIERHKWFLSQNAGHDVGFENAAADWVANYAAKWRVWGEEQPESSPR